jgi:hypothetical protein
MVIGGGRWGNTYLFSMLDNETNPKWGEEGGGGAPLKMLS